MYKHHLDSKSLLGFGYWIEKQWKHTQKLKSEAEAELD